MLRTGAGMGAPGLKSSHRISLSASGSARSTSEKSSLADASAPLPLAGLRAIRSIVTGTSSYGRRSASAVKVLIIGVAAASYCVIGGSFKISSMVRRYDAVVYIVLSTTPRLVYGE